MSPMIIMGIGEGEQRATHNHINRRTIYVTGGVVFGFMYPTHVRTTKFCSMATTLQK